MTSPVFSWGLALDIEIIGWSGYTKGSMPEASPDEDIGPDLRLEGEWLVTSRAQLLFRWDLAPGAVVSPHLTGGVGLGASHASTHSIQCTPHDPMGPGPPPRRSAGACRHP
jgi:hypothetical protein